MSAPVDLFDVKKLDTTVIGGGARLEAEYAAACRPYVSLRKKYRGVGGYKKVNRADSGRAGKATKKKNGITETPVRVKVLVLDGGRRRWEWRAES